MLISYKLTATGIILRVKMRDSTSGFGTGLTGLTNASSGLVISTIADNEATATAYTAAGSTIDTITTLGTYAAPTATHCRFKQVDSTNHKGIYEIQLDNARFAVNNAKSLLVSWSGAANLADGDALIPLTSVDPYDGVHFGLTALPNAAAGSANGLIVNGATAYTPPANWGVMTIDAGTGATRAFVTDWGAIGHVVAWDSTNSLPQVSSSFTVLQSVDKPAFHSGAAQVSSSDTTHVHLANTADGTTDDIYKGNTIEIYGGTGLAESRVITAYNHTTKVATVAPALPVVVDATSQYRILGYRGPQVNSSLNPTADSVVNGVTVTTNNDKAGYSLLASDHTAIAGDVLNVVATSYNTAGTIGAKINAAGNAGDPWSVSLPGSYASGTAGNIVGNNIDAKTSTRAATGAQMDLVNAPNATAVTALANGLLDLASAIDPSGGADTVRKALRLVLAACAGKLSGAATTTNVITDTTGAKNRISATVDSSGDRTALSYDMS